MHRIMQDLQQIRTISQQLQASERQNAQMLAQQNGMAGMAQTETHAAQQLGQIIQLCNQAEQQVQQQMTMQNMQQQNMQPQNMQHQPMQHQPMQNSLQQAMRPMQPGYQQHSYPGIAEVMQADRQAQQQNQPYSQQFGQMAQVMQADHQNQQQNQQHNQPYGQMGQPQRTNYANYAQPQHMQPAYTTRPGFTPGLSQVMQADKTAEQGPSRSNYN
ncbi:hypothetical protein [Alicyclobacillus sp. SO9]|uniref:hypothetical protein n=1 Tax=Alicyclobacillus sp. SO9 TaxID=2665646 RepID=UPI0018E8C562|nr:hypothetical protein [Alicyclobacillus sp. SO9]